MLKLLPSCVPVVLAGCLLLAHPVSAVEDIQGNLATVQWLEKHLNDPGVMILDASPTQAYVARHIPGAVSVDLFLHGLPDMPGGGDMEEQFQAWGVSPEKTLVLYDQGGSINATRLFFSLYYYGVPANHMVVLDGGLAMWQEQDLPVTAELPPPKPGSFLIDRLNREAKVELPEFLTGSGDPAHHALIEALGADWHYGQVLAFNKAGHIPNSTLLPSTDFYNPDKTFKSAEEIRKMLAYFHVRPEQQIYTYCGGGVAASVPWFALKFILNYPNVKMYVGSELDWLSDQRELPYWTYDAPFLMRDSNWLQFWSSPMLRMAGVAHVSIVDLRSADEYSQGHVPFALNIPAAAFRTSLEDPEKLAEILGPSGVNASEEAVLISGAGLTKDSALAFVLLEKLGQKKVSVSLDSMEKWTQLGFTVSKKATVVAPKKAAQDVSIPSTGYALRLRDGVLIDDLKSSQGLYPKVFVAAGKEIPANAPEGKVVHLPYTDLLNADGTPKAAKEIWSILTMAGVPRYAELVCVSDDPGEAAIDYFILKLMGFPDIKVFPLPGRRAGEFRSQSLN